MVEEIVDVTLLLHLFAKQSIRTIKGKLKLAIIIGIAIGDEDKGRGWITGFSAIETTELRRRC